LVADGIAAPGVPAATNIRISCRGVSKSYFDVAEGREVVALAALDLDIADGEFVTILGPSGCGKSTLLNIIAGFDQPTSGRVLLDGAPIGGPGHDRGVVFQEYALFPWLTVEQNVAYGLKEQHLPAEEIKERTTSWIRLVGLDGYQRRYMHELSGGMRQRVALSRVLANDPKSLLMDEPFAAVDAQTRTLLQRELEQVWLRTHKTVLFVTHSVDEAVFLADRVLVMTARPGRVKEIIPIDLPRPRDITSDQFNEYRRLATQLIEEEVTLR
jgi:ABC-type nitrate/sulfonate/bicarbonate transport system ATPase subunit